MASPPHILVVDDDVDVRQSLCDLLEDEGYRISSADNGAAALALIRDGARPDLVITDLLMPEMSGAELIAALRADAELARIPVLAFSAASAAQPPPDVRVLRKPISVEVMLRELRRLLE